MITPTRESLEKIKYIANNMEGQQFHFHSHILYDIRTFLGKEPKNYLEIGVAYGMSAALVSAHPYETNCYLVDLGLPDGIDKIVHNNLKKFKNTKSKYNYYIGNSNSDEIANQIKNSANSFDLIFIDGLHTRNGVMNDFYKYSHMLNSGGVLVFDDYLDKLECPEVGPAIDDLVKLHGDQYHIVGSIDYDFVDEFSEILKSNNLFVMIKK